MIRMLPQLGHGTNVYGFIISTSISPITSKFDRMADRHLLPDIEDMMISPQLDHLTNAYHIIFTSINPIRFTLHRKGD